MQHRELRRRHTAPTPPWSPYALGVIWGSAFGVFLAVVATLVVVLP